MDCSHNTCDSRDSSRKPPEDERVLIVDDDEAILESLSAILRLEGYTVDTAQTGAEALEKCKAQSFDLALINLGLPDMDGIELLTPMHENTPRTVKIILTGFPKEEALKAIRRGADDYLIKPVNPQDLLKMLKDKLRKN